MHDASFDHLADDLRFQGASCAMLGSPVWAEVLRRMADDVAADGPTRDICAAHRDDRFGLAIPLRLLSGLHELALTGASTRLAARLPSCTGTALDVSDGRVADDLWTAVTAAFSDHADALAAALDADVQTNEVARSAGLAVGLAAIRSMTGLPLHLFEIGTSAGLNLRVDHFHLDPSTTIPGAATLGGATSPVVLAGLWDTDPGFGNVPMGDLQIERRAGCDPAPIDPTTDAGVARLRSFIWPDQTTRDERLRAAIAVARAHPAELRRAPAGTFVPAVLAEPHPGAVAVIQHSIMWQYIDKEERPRIVEAIEAAGAAATPDAPVAWVAYEPAAGQPHAAVTLRLWPQAPEPTVVAHADFHGRWVRPLVKT